MNAVLSEDKAREVGRSALWQMARRVLSSIGSGSKLSAALTAVLVLYVASGCLQPPPQPPEDLELVVNSMELSFQQDVKHLFEFHTDMDDRLNESLGSVAAMGFEWDTVNAFLEPPSTWPDAFDEQEFYFWYAAQNRNVLWEFGTFYITHMFGNPFPGECDPTDLSFVGGASSSAYNNVSLDRLSRWSFIFMIDVDEFPKSCGLSDARRQNFMTHVLAHEIGHQRAGLTHANDPSYIQHHRGMPIGQIDVMETQRNVWDMSNDPYPRYCRTGRVPRPNDFSSCQGVLFYVRHAP